MTEFASAWDQDLAIEFGPVWFEPELLSGSLIDVEHLVEVVDAVLRGGHACRSRRSRSRRGRSRRVITRR